MAYKRKTQDEIDVEGNYGADWECVTGAATRKEARAYVKEYRENEPGVPFRIKVHRVRIQEEAHG